MDRGKAPQLAILLYKNPGDPVVVQTLQTTVLAAKVTFQFNNVDIPTAWYLQSLSPAISSTLVHPSVHPSRYTVC